MTLRILYHHRVRDVDGQSVHVRALQRAFVGLGHEVHEVALVPLLPAALRDEQRGDFPGQPRKTLWRWIKHLPVPLVELAEHGFSLVSFRNVRRAAARLRPDLVYERYAFGNVGCVLAARRAGIPHILEVNSPFVAELAETRGLWLPRAGRRAERFLFSRTDLICVVSGVLRDMLLAAGVPRERVLLTRNGVDLEWFDYGERSAANAEARRRLGLGARAGVEGEVVLGFTGYPRAWNRLDLVLEAMKRQGLENARLVVVGESPLIAAILRTARRMNLGDRLKLVGTCDHREVVGLLPAFDIMVLAGTSSFSSPLKLHEWMAAGLAIVAADQPNLREVLDHERNCLLAPAGDAGALAAAIRALARDPERRARLGSAARADIVARGLTWRGNAEAIVAATEEIRRRRAD